MIVSINNLTYDNANPNCALMQLSSFNTMTDEACILLLVRCVDVHGYENIYHGTIAKNINDYTKDEQTALITAIMEKGGDGYALINNVKKL